MSVQGERCNLVVTQPLLHRRNYALRSSLPLARKRAWGFGMRDRWGTLSVILLVIAMAAGMSVLSVTYPGSQRAQATDEPDAAVLDRM